MSLDHSKFISRIYHEDFTNFAALGVLPEMVDASCRPVYIFILTHFNQFSKLPDRLTIKRHFPSFKFYKTKEPIQYYAKILQTSYRAAKLRGAVAEISGCYNDNKIDEALAVYQKLYGEIFKDIQALKTVNYGDMLSSIQASLEAPTFDVPFGVPVMDEDLMGLANGDWALLAGTAAAGKTWLLLKMLHNLWLKHKYKILLISNELGIPLLRRRLHSITLGIDYGRFRRNELTADEQEKIVEYQTKDISHLPAFNIIAVGNAGAGEKLGSLDSIKAKVQYYKPDILAIDGQYIGMDMDKWGNTMSYCNDFHTLLQELNIPAITTSQLKAVADASKPRLNDLAFTAAFQQATDFVFLLAKDEKMRAEKTAVLTVGKAREAEDHQQYFVEFDPGAKIDVIRMAPTITNPLSEDVFDAEADN